MNIEDMKIMIDLVNTQSFSKCAELNHLTQPAISQKIKLFERGFKTQLFIRGKNSINLTNAGKLLFDESKKIVDSYAHVLSKIRSLSGVLQGSVKISAIYSIGLYGLNDIVKSFIEKYPMINPDMEFNYSLKIYKDLMDEKIDIGFVAYPKENSKITVTPFKKDGLTLVVSPRHQLAGFKKIDIRKLNNCDFIGFKEDVPTGRAISEIFKKYKTAVKMKMEFDNIELIKRAVEINAGISILPSSTVVQEEKNNVLRCIPFSNENITRPLAVLTKKDKKLSPAAQKFIEELPAA